MTSKVIVIISNEDGQTLEPEAWIPVAKLQAADKILGFFRFGDYHQFTPVVLTDYPTQGYNEFSMQLSYLQVRCPVERCAVNATYPSYGRNSSGYRCVGEVRVLLRAERIPSTGYQRDGRIHDWRGHEATL